jgi:hypothetical protein
MMYRTQLEDIAIPLEDKAVERYKKTIQKARDEKIVNKWTKKTLNELNKYRPKEFPLYKESKSAAQKHTITGRPLLTTMPTIKEGASGMEESSPANEAGGDSSDNSNTDGDKSSGSSEKQTQDNGESES